MQSTRKNQLKRFLYVSTNQTEKWQSCLVDWSNHVCLQFEEPLFHLSTSFSRRDGITQFNHFTFTALHVCDIKDVCELQRCDSLEAFLEMRLDSARTSALKHSYHSLTCFNSTTKRLKMLKVSLALNEHISELRDVTCHIGSHSVTCHPTQVNAPRLNPSQAGRYSIYLPRRDGRLSWPGRLG